MDTNVYCKDTEKIVYGVHLELAVQIQVYCLYSIYTDCLSLSH